MLDLATAAGALVRDERDATAVRFTLAVASAVTTSLLAAAVSLLATTAAALSTHMNLDGC